MGIFEAIRLNEVSQRKTNTVWSHLHVKLKATTKWVHRYKEQIGGHQRWGEGSGQNEWR